MNRKTIAKLWNGEIEPYARSGEDNAEIKDLENAIRLSYENLEGSLSKEQKKLLDEYRDSIDYYMAVISEQAFCEGFCLGTRLTSEAFTKE